MGKTMMFVHKVALAVVAVVALAPAAYAAPPGPPVVASTPSVPVGGPGVVVVTSLIIAGYGVWRSRK